MIVAPKNEMIEQVEGGKVETGTSCQKPLCWKNTLGFDGSTEAFEGRVFRKIIYCVPSDFIKKSILEFHVTACVNFNLYNLVQYIQYSTVQGVVNLSSVFIQTI